MEIKLTIGVTPALEKALVRLAGLTALAAAPQYQEPAQTQSVPAPAPIPVAQPVAPVQPAVPVTPPAAPVAPVQPQPEPVSVPTAAQSYSMDQLAVAATQLMDAGKRNELLQLLASFGVNALTELPKEQYGNFATQLRGLGAKI